MGGAAARAGFGRRHLPFGRALNRAQAHTIVSAPDARAAPRGWGGHHQSSRRPDRFLPLLLLLVRTPKHNIGRRQGSRLQIQIESSTSQLAWVGDSSPSGSQKLERWWRGVEVAGSRRMGRITAAAEDRGYMWWKRSARPMPEVGRHHWGDLATGKDARLGSRNAVGRPRADGPGGEDLMGLQVCLCREVGCSGEEKALRGRE